MFTPEQFPNNPLRSRADLQRLLHDMVDPILPHFSPGCAQVRLSDNRALYGDPPGWLEGYARPLWGLVPLAAGGGAFDHWELWRQGMASGADPAHEEYWGLTGDYDQRSVEQAAFGVALAMAPNELWHPLAPEVKQHLSAWLQNINKVKLVNSNWLFFRVLVNLGLRRCGEPHSMELIAEDAEKLDSYYVGDGWYADGSTVGNSGNDGRTGDYYIPMAFQYYSLLYAQLAADFDPERAARYKERARLFAHDFQYWFTADGAALPFGRSLTYRFAQGAFWGALAFADVEALPWSVIKGLYMRHLRWWMQQPVFSETGLLTIGYTYPNLLMAESYNSPGSPYWALKAFLPLALPESHPFWQAEEAPLPKRRAVHTVPGAKLVMTTDPRTREVTAICPGQPVLDWPRHAPQKYSKCAYSTHFGFSVRASSSTASEGGLDSVLSLSDDGRFFKHREQCMDVEVRDGVAYSRWQAWPDVELRTWLIADSTGHVRIHHIKTGRKLWTLEAGFATNWYRRATVDNAVPGIVRTPHGASMVQNLLAECEAGSSEVGANSHLLASLSFMPTLRSEHKLGEFWLASRVEGAADPQTDFTASPGFTVEESAGFVCVLRDGEIWWNMNNTPCGESSPARLKTLEELV
ncbi:TPA: hypothetical protein DDW35_04445 [Candidatus Sumerlaeota bacterium]|nr:hypothetical protein [Candidatus Sumerlaeota bacterium]